MLARRPETAKKLDSNCPFMMFLPPVFGLVPFDDNEAISPELGEEPNSLQLPPGVMLIVELLSGLDDDSGILAVEDMSDFTDNSGQSSHVLSNDSLVFSKVCSSLFPVSPCFCCV